MTVENRWALPDLGLGLGLRTVHYGHIFEHWPELGWFEIISENFLDTQGLPLFNLDRISAQYPIVMHGVSLNIGSTDPLDWDYLRKLKALAERCKAVWMGDHICWTGVSGINGHDLYPLPYNEESLQHVARRVREVQDFLERPLVLENPSTYLGFKSSTMSEPEWIARLCDEADCALLLDVNNVYVSSRNHDDFDAQSYLDIVPLDRVVQVHLAGHTDKGTHCIDTHDHPVCDPVWQLYSELMRRAGNRATLLEWDDSIPSFDECYAELAKAKAYRADAVLAATESEARND